MRFIHDDPEWQDLLLVVAESTGRQVALVEKDYWVTHTLWALHAQGFEVWFKGGTSLSKGFGLIERFSEDLDVRIDAGEVSGIETPALPWEDNNKRRRKRGIAERDVWFDDLARVMSVPACAVQRNPDGSDDRVRSAWLEVTYPTRFADGLPPAMRPFVLLEIGRARIVPSVSCSLTSWVHDHLHDSGQLGDYAKNRPGAVRCVHPWVTCVEKLDAIARRYDKQRDPASYVRHYEDISNILRRRVQLPAIDYGVRDLAELVAHEDRMVLPGPNHPAFSEVEISQNAELQEAWDAIGPMFWGTRTPLAEAAASIREFLNELA